MAELPGSASDEAAGPTNHPNLTLLRMLTVLNHFSMPITTTSLLLIILLTESAAWALLNLRRGFAWFGWGGTKRAITIPPFV